MLGSGVRILPAPVSSVVVAALALVALLLAVSVEPASGAYASGRV